MSNLPFTFARLHQVVLDPKNGNHLYHVNPMVPNILQALSPYIAKDTKLIKISESQYENLLQKAYESDEKEAVDIAADFSDRFDLGDLVDTLPQANDLLDEQSEAPIIRLLNAILTRAIRDKASDIHLEGFENAFHVRIRIDGVLQNVLMPPRIAAPLLVSRIKVMAGLNIAEKRLPQDGRMRIKLGGKSVDIRVSTIPTNHGERVVLRILDKDTSQLDLSSLGLSDSLMQSFESLIQRTHGIILVTGPTGSGKTTSLYAALSRLNTECKNILTVEDPIEYDLSGISQMQLNAKAEMTFSKGLRAILRQDPDIVMVGEIRDVETAEIAIQASLTGHLVFSTLHTNSAVGAITRLIDMGIPPFLLSGSIVGVLAQRLVRKLCLHCRKPVESLQQNDYFEQESSDQLFAAEGCMQCHYTGYSGRLGIYELLIVDDEISRKISHQESFSLPKEKRLQWDGFQKVKQGMTTIEEVLRVARESSQ